MAIISIIIPTLNESSTIGSTLAELSKLSAIELIVADGGSHDKTTDIARGYASRIVSAPRGRAPQMNAGAKAATGDILLFLHADCMPPENFHTLICNALNEQNVAAGAFDLSIKHKGMAYRLIERMANLRSRLTRLPYGDQGIFIRRQTFKDMGGFSDIPLMEDIVLGRRLKRAGRVIFLRQPIKTSPRRWQREGILYTTLLDWAIVIAYALGVSPKRLAKYYRQAR